MQRSLRVFLSPVPFGGRRRPQLVFEPSRLAFPGLDSMVPSALRRDVETCLAPAVRDHQLLNLFHLPATSAASFLRLLTEGEGNWTSSQKFPHIDYAASFAATMGLNDFRGTSVGFYAANELGGTMQLRSLPDMAKYKLLSLAQYASGRGPLESHAQLVFQREVLQNRVIFYPAWVLHKAHIPKTAAQQLSSNPLHGRLTLNLFYTADAGTDMRVVKLSCCCWSVFSGKLSLRFLPIPRTTIQSGWAKLPPTSPRMQSCERT